MKTEEDEAFDDLAKRQGSWGGGYQAKRQMAADKLQEPEREALKMALRALETERDIYCEHDEDGAPEYILDAIARIKAALAQPAQEPVAHLWECLGRWSAYLVTNGTQADCAPPSWLVDAIQNATTPPQRPWVGLTPEETSGFTQHEMTVAKYVSKVLQEKNT